MTHPTVRKEFTKEKPILVLLKGVSKEPKGRVGSAVFLGVVFLALFAQFVSPYDPNAVDSKATFQLFSFEHLLGTDEFGRDVLSRIIWGSRLTLVIGSGTLLLNIAMGVSMGLVAGYYGGKFDDVLMRIVDIILSFPGLIFALAIMAVLGSSINNLIFVLGVIYTPSVARVTRSAVLAEKPKQYVEAARGIGKKDIKIALFEILPNCIGPVTVQVTLNFASVVLTEASLSFLGLGVQPPDIAWGSMLFEARGYLNVAPWVAVSPGAIIFIVVMGINMLGDALRDVADPFLRR